MLKRVCRGDGLRCDDGLRPHGRGWRSIDQRPPMRRSEARRATASYLPYEPVLELPVPVEVPAPELGEVGEVGEVVLLEPLEPLELPLLMPDEAPVELPLPMLDVPPEAPLELDLLK